MSYLVNPYMVSAPVSYLVDHTDIGSKNGDYGLSSGITGGESATTSSSEFVGKYFDNIQVYLNGIGGGGGETVTCSHSNNTCVDKVVYWTINLSTVTSTTWYGDGLFSGSDVTWVTGDKLKLVLSLSDGRVEDLLPLIEYGSSGASWDGANSRGFYDCADQELKDIFFKCALN